MNIANATNTFTKKIPMPFVFISIVLILKRMKVN